MVERFHVGQRVRLKKTLATKPPRLFRRGATGTVANPAGVGESEGEITVWVRMDRHFPHLAQWDNALLVKCSDVTDETRGLWARLRTAWQGEWGDADDRSSGGGGGV
jgi:hypothetical protein